MQPEASHRDALVFYHFGDSYLTGLGQEIGTPLGRVFDSYRRVTLLSASPTRADADRAGEVGQPTVTGFLRAVESMTPGFDVFVFAHGSPGAFYAENGPVTLAALEGLGACGARFVWQTNCFGASLLPGWRKMGAVTAVGAARVNFFPSVWSSFSRRWLTGSAPIAAALGGLPTRMAKTAVHAYLMGDAAARIPSWDGSILDALKVISDHPASRRYFDRCWSGSEWNESGADTIERSSETLISGDRNLLFRS